MKSKILINFFLIKNFISFFFSFIICIFLTNKFIYIFYKFNFIQNSKNINNILDKNVPTMGGIFIILSIIINMIIFIKYDLYYTLIILITILGYGLLGFIDDYIKINKKYEKSGISSINKYITQSIITIVVIFLIKNILLINNLEKIMFIPFLGYKVFYNKIIFYLLSYFTIIGSCNSTNIVDGLDGLALKLIINILISFIIIIYSIFYKNLFNISNIIYFENLINTCFIIFGSTLGFLWFNSYPSNIFIGDIGSLVLGSLIGIISILIRNELTFFILGNVFVLETISVIIQIICIRFLKKKFFTIAPIHHSYQIKGINESKIVTRFLIISVIINLFGLLSYFC